MKCRLCLEEKESEQFVKHRNNVCRQCETKRTTGYQKKKREANPLEWYPRSTWTSVNQRTINGIYSAEPSVKANPQHKSYLAKSIEIRMCKDDWFLFWQSNSATAQQIICAGDIPTVDRIDSSGHYEKGNVRIIGKAQNLLREDYGELSIEDALAKLGKTSDEDKQKNRRQYVKHHSGTDNAK